MPADPAGAFAARLESGVDLVTGQGHEVQRQELRGLRRHILGIITVQPEDDFIAAVGIDSGLDVWGKLSAILVGYGVGNAKTTGLS